MNQIYIQSQLQGLNQLENPLFLKVLLVESSCLQEKGQQQEDPQRYNYVKQIDAEQGWFELMDKKGEKISESEDLKRLIETEIEKVAGKNKGISPVPVKVKYYSKEILDLQLIELLGITKNRVSDQPQNIIQRVLDIVMPFIKNQNSQILAVSKVSDDLATSDGLKLVRCLDPNRLRTIGEITQLDPMEEGSDALNDLLNQTYPIEIGVCRSNKERQMNNLKNEKVFFKNHKLYKKYSEKMGVNFLVKALNINFIQHIKKASPNIRKTLISLVQIKEFGLKYIIWGL